jgi:hypothetical protein
MKGKKIQYFALLGYNFIVIAQKCGMTIKSVTGGTGTNGPILDNYQTYSLGLLLAKVALLFTIATCLKGFEASLTNVMIILSMIFGHCWVAFSLFIIITSIPYSSL